MTEKDWKQSLHCPNCGAAADPEQPFCEYCHAVLSVTACPSCFGPVFKGMRFCPHCGGEAQHKEIDVSVERHCPRCGTPLRQAETGRVVFFECDRCQGVWIGSDAFQKICERKEKEGTLPLYDAADSTAATADPVITGTESIAADPKARHEALGRQTAEPAGEPAPGGRFYIPCPECGKLMNRKNFAGCSGVIIDFCKPHGLWFDRKELQQIADFIDAGGLHKARQKELDALKAEKEHLREIRQEIQTYDVSVQGHRFSYQFLLTDSLFDAVASLWERLS